VELNIKALQELFKNTNTSYKYLFFYALIKIIKNDNSKKHISFNKIIREMLIIAWLPSFQFNLNFRKQDQIKYLLKSLNKNTEETIKSNKPTNKIIRKIYLSIDNSLKNNQTANILENQLLRYVMVRLLRPFYRRLKKMPESGKISMHNLSNKILIKDYKKEQPPYQIDENNREIILNKKWTRYIKEHYLFLELWVLDEWYKYMQYQNRNSPSLYEKLKFPKFQRGSLDKQRKFWKKIIKQHEIKCIFTNEILNEDNFDIDHFICWNFLAHDQEWNLIPVLSEINRSKNNKIPDRKFIDLFTDFKIKSFNYARTILSPKKYNEYLAEHSNFINFSHKQCFTPSFKSKYNEEINSLASKAKNQGFEEFNAR
jgi:hypothetical protein